MPSGHTRASDFKNWQSKFNNFSFQKKKKWKLPQKTQNQPSIFKQQIKQSDSFPVWRHKKHSVISVKKVQKQSIAQRTHFVDEQITNCPLTGFIEKGWLGQCHNQINTTISLASLIFIAKPSINTHFIVSMVWETRKQSHHSHWKCLTTVLHKIYSVK